MTTEQPGRSLERLVATLESALANTGATIEAPCRRLIDRDTGKAREHDVLITWDHGHHQIITAIECRDRSRPVGVPDVEAFSDKCASTGVNSGVMVSARGFRKTARIKAKTRAITLMDLTEAESFEWLGLDAIVGYQRMFRSMNMKIMFIDEMPDVISAIFDASGVELNSQQISSIIRNHVPFTEDPEKYVGIYLPVRINLKTIGWTVRDADDKIWSISHILADTEFSIEKTINPVALHRYAGGGKNYSIASADVSVGEHQGKLMMVRNEDDTTSVLWAPNSYGTKPTC